MRGTGISATEQLVLRAMADLSGASTTVGMTVKAIAELAGLSVDVTVAALRALDEKGFTNRGSKVEQAHVESGPLGDIVSGVSALAAHKVKATMRVANALLAVARPMCNDDPFEVMAAAVALCSMAASVAKDPNALLDAAIESLVITRGLPRLESDPPAAPDNAS